MRSIPGRHSDRMAGMGETKKIVVEHYPVDKLPEDLRRGLDDGMRATVTVEIDLAVDAHRVAHWSR